MKKILCLLMVSCTLFLFGCTAGENRSGGGVTQPTTTVPTTEPQATYPEPDKLIALTFDDGPNVHMDTIVDVLEQYGAKATFFVIGKKISDSTGATIKRAYDLGHEIGNHSFNHVKLSELTEAEILDEVEKTQAAVEAITGERPAWFRAPFLSTSTLMYDLIDQPFAGSGVSAGDGSNDNLPEDRHYRVVNGAYDGAIVLLHCNDITAEVLPQILEDLKMQGYEFVTVSELFARTNVIPDTEAEIQYKDTGAE